jgi:putative membrane protein
MMKKKAVVATKRDGFWLRIIALVSVVAIAAIAFLILGPRPEGLHGTLDVSALPAVNCTLNAITAMLLITGVLLIRQKRIELHRKVMLTAFGSSFAFLVSYVLYHWFKSGPTYYIGEWTKIYYFILITHIFLAAVIVPLALVTLYRGWQMQVSKHRFIAKITYPLWLYVSVTGVVIYVMLY